MEFVDDVFMALGWLRHWRGTTKVHQDHKQNSAKNGLFRKRKTHLKTSKRLLFESALSFANRRPAAAPRGAPSPLLLFAHARDLGFLASCARPGGLFVAFFRPWPLPGPRSQFLALGQKKEKDAATGILEELGVLKKDGVLNWAFLGEFRFCRIVEVLWGVIEGDVWCQLVV